MKRVIILAALIIVGCSSRSLSPSPTTFAKPEIYQGHGGGQWVVVKTHHNLFNNIPLHWFGTGMVVLGSPGLLYVSESGKTSAQAEPWGGGPDGGFDSGNVIGPDQNLWLSAYDIYSANKSGQATTYATPHHNATQITVGTDGALWFGEYGPNAELGRITTSGLMTETPYQGSGGPNIVVDSIATGSDGNFWATGQFNGIDRVTPAGVVTNFAVPGGSVCLCNRVVPGPDGAIWFIGQNNGRYLGRMAMDGTANEFDATGSNPMAITFTPDGIMWILATSGGFQAVQSFDLSTHQFSAPVAGPSSLSSTYAIAPGPDGNLWLSGLGQYVGVYLRQPLTVTPSPLTINTPGQTANLTVTEANYSGDWSGSSSNKSIATVKRSGTPGILTVTAVGVGSCTITVGDSMFNTVKVSVTVQ